MSVTTPDNLCPLEKLILRGGERSPAWSRRTQVGSPASEASILGRSHQTRHDDDAPSPWWSAGAPAARHPPSRERESIRGLRVDYVWATCGLRVDYAWATRGLRVDHTRTGRSRPHEKRTMVSSPTGLSNLRDTPSWQTVISPELARPGRQIFLLESRHVR